MLRRAVHPQRNNAPPPSLNHPPLNCLCVACAQDEALQRFVELMDDDSGAGWELLAALMVGEAPAHELLECRFCSVNVA